MEEKILEIVFYLVQHARNHDGRLVPLKTISRDLKNLGFTESEISSAYGWFLDELQRDGGRIHPLPQAPQSVRVMSPEEMQNFSPEAAGFLLQLLHLRLVTPAQFERIVEKSYLFATEKIDLSLVKMIASRYVFSSGSAVDLNWFNLDENEVPN